MTREEWTAKVAESLAEEEQAWREINMVAAPAANAAVATGNLDEAKRVLDQANERKQAATRRAWGWLEST